MAAEGDVGTTASRSGGRGSCCIVSGMSPPRRYKPPSSLDPCIVVTAKAHADGRIQNWVPVAPPLLKGEDFCANNFSAHLRSPQFQFEACGRRSSTVALTSLDLVAS
mmetsp:Transcript_4954/g.14407  ORF Transcript_4954/g.14407 Transcript_4954/m.14407 type:complete len:107 (-) Transcript_4954:850-1170(-)